MKRRTRDRRDSGAAAAIAPAPTRRRRAAAFQVTLLGLVLLFVTLAVLAHGAPYFAFDLRITRAFQAHRSPVLAGLMYALSWLGFLPQVAWIGIVVVAGLFAFGLRWESIALLFAASGVAVGTLVKFIVYRPRPSSDLVRVLNRLASPSFPSGHVLEFTTFCGFLVFLAYTLPARSWQRAALITSLAAVVLLMGPSRIYLGQHWFSDVMGAYVLGGLWLALTIRFYQWGKTRYFVDQRVAPEQ